MRPQPRLLYPIGQLSLLLVLFGVVATGQTAPAAPGMAAAISPPPTASPTFEVATVKAAPQADPNTGAWSFPGIGRFTASHVSLAVLIRLAYDVGDIQIANKPAWMESNLYDVDARLEAGIKLSREELKPRLQDLLRQRFHLIVHTETRSVRGYGLVVVKSGPHLVPTKAEHFPGWRNNVSSGQMRGANWSMQHLTKYLSEAAGFPVVDQTGIAGNYDVGFSYNPKLDADSDFPPLGAALEQATGLQLKEQKVPVETIVIDSVDKVPTEN